MTAMPPTTVPRRPSIERQRRGSLRRADLRASLATAQLATALLAIALLAIAMTLIVAGCSTTGEATTPTIRLAPTSTPITTVSTTVSDATSTTQPAVNTQPSMTEAAHIAEIEAAVAAARNVQVEVLTDPSIPVDRMEEVATGRALAATVENTLKSRAEGRTFVGDFVGVPRETELLGDAMARHLQCGLDRLAAYSASGDLITPADDTPYLLRYTLEHDTNLGWRVELVAYEGSEPEPCVL